MENDRTTLYPQLDSGPVNQGPTLSSIQGIVDPGPQSRECRYRRRHLGEFCQLTYQPIPCATNCPLCYSEHCWLLLVESGCPAGSHLPQIWVSTHPQCQAWVLYHGLSSDPVLPPGEVQTAWCPLPLCFLSTHGKDLTVPQSPLL